MTAEEIKKAIADGAAEALAPLCERIEKLEAAAAPPGEGTPAPVEKNDDPETPAEAPDAEALTKMVKDGIAEAIAPIEKRLKDLEDTEGERQSSLDVQGAHKINKSADGFWEGSGLLI